MEFIDYKCLESLLIEGEDLIAEEGLNKDVLLATGMLIGETALIGMGLWFGAKKFENMMNRHKTHKANLPKSYGQTFDAFKKVNDLYHFDNFDKSEYNKFIMKIMNRCNDIIEYGVNELNNSTELISQCNDIYSKSKYNKPGSDLLTIKSKIFTAKWVPNKHCWIIIDDTDIAQAISSMHIPQGCCEELQQRFELFIDANLIDFEYDNLKGCIYFTYMTYAQMRNVVEKSIKKKNNGKE